MPEMSKLSTSKTCDQYLEQIGSIGNSFVTGFKEFEKFSNTLKKDSSLKDLKYHAEQLANFRAFFTNLTAATIDLDDELGKFLAFLKDIK